MAALLAAAPANSKPVAVRSSAGSSSSAPSNQSSGYSYAQPSKEWIVPARPKPGRKPSTNEPPTKRQSQNRASQRAFRERRQAHLSELEAKISAYEAGELHKSVEFQRIAQKLKAQNDNLMAERQTWEKEKGDLVKQVTALRERLSIVGRERDVWKARCAKVEIEATHLRRNLVADGRSVTTVRRTVATSASAAVQIRSGVIINTAAPTRPNTVEPMAVDAPALTSTLRRTSISSTPRPHLSNSAQDKNRSSRPSALALSLRDTDPTADQMDADASIDPCGFCSSSASDACVCKEFARAQQIAERGEDHAKSNLPTAAIAERAEARMDVDEYDRLPSEGRTTGARATGASSSILDNPPPFRPAMPLRLTRNGTRETSELTAQRMKLWETRAAVPASETLTRSGIPAPASVSAPPTEATESLGASPPLMCSGDPQTCPACATDPVLAEFCDAVSGSSSRQVLATPAPPPIRSDPTTSIPPPPPFTPTSAPGGLTCSGDPSTCAACGSDPTLADFCRKVSRSVCDGAASGDSTLERAKSVLGELPRMGRIENTPVTSSVRRQHHDDSIPPASPEHASSLNVTVADRLMPMTMPPCASAADARRSEHASEEPRRIRSQTPGGTSIPEAYRQLKQHPNFDVYAGYRGNLGLLADVVARRTTCIGPEEIEERDEEDLRRSAVPIKREADTDLESPATSEVPLSTSSVSSSVPLVPTGRTSQSPLLTATNMDGGPPTLVPVRTLQEDGAKRRRLMTVDDGAVREALALLDRGF